jgi:hypothetical protein
MPCSSRIRDRGVFPRGHHELELCLSVARRTEASVGRGRPCTLVLLAPLGDDAAAHVGEAGQALLGQFQSEVKLDGLGWAA